MRRFKLEEEIIDADYTLTCYKIQSLKDKVVSPKNNCDINSLMQIIILITTSYYNYVVNWILSILIWFIDHVRTMASQGVGV